MGYSYKIIVNYFIKQDWMNKNLGINPLKLIKLIYFAHGWTLALRNEVLVNEPIIAFKYGITMDFMKNLLIKHGTRGISEYFYQDNQEYIFFCNDNPIQLILKNIWNAYKDFNNFELAPLTTKEGTPWDLSFKKRNILMKFLKKRVIISNDTIKSYFINQLSNETNPYKSPYDLC